MTVKVAVGKNIHTSVVMEGAPAKIFGIVALASVGVVELMSLGACLASIFGHSWGPNLWDDFWDYIWDYIDLAADVGLCVAYIMLLISKVRNSFAIWGVVGCGLLVLSELMLPANSEWQWLLWRVNSLIGSLFVAISIIRFPKTVHFIAKVVGLIGIGYLVLLNLSPFIPWFSIFHRVSAWTWCLAYALIPVPFVVLLYSCSPQAIRLVSLLYSCSPQVRRFVALLFSCSTQVSATLVKVFAGSVFFLGFVVFIFNLVCGSPSVDPGSWSSEKCWDYGFVVTAFYTLFANILLGFFILSQVKVRNCLESLEAKIDSSGPICLVIVQVALYIVFVVCVISLIWALCADDYDFRRALEDGFISDMSLDMFRQLSRIKKVINLRTYFTIGMLVVAWYSIGLAKLMALMRENSAKAYSLKGTDDGTSDAQEA